MEGITPGQAQCSYGNTVRLMTPVRLSQSNAMPHQSGLAKQLVERKPRIVTGHISSQSRRNQVTHKTVDIGMPFEQPPVEPTYFILAIGVIVSALGAAHLVSHLEHRRAEGKEFASPR